MLRSVAAGGLSLGAVGTASASRGLSAGEIEQAVGAYRDVDAVRSVFADEQALLETVAEAGYIDAPTVDAPGVQTLGAPTGAGDARVGVTAREVDGEVAPALTVRKPVEGGWLVFAVRPAQDRSFAVYEPADGEGEVIAGDLESTGCKSCVDCTGISCPGCSTCDCIASSCCEYSTREPVYTC
ncbi:MAG: hypothetical protein ABEI99_08995 [Halobaculum sp.]